MAVLLGNEIYCCVYAHVAFKARSAILQCRGPKQSRVVVLPVDASCEDLEVDPGLPFLNSFVQQATNAGAISLKDAPT